MILDTSAILAILFKEADAPYFARKIAAALPCRMSVANLLEASIVIGGRGESAESDLDRFVDTAEIELMPVTAEQVARAPRSVAAIRQGQPSRRAQLRRLLCLCARAVHRRTVAVQGGGLLTH